MRSQMVLLMKYPASQVLHCRTEVLEYSLQFLMGCWYLHTFWILNWKLLAEQTLQEFSYVPEYISHFWIF